MSESTKNNNPLKNPWAIIAAVVAAGVLLVVARHAQAPQPTAVESSATATAAPEHVKTWEEIEVDPIPAASPAVIAHYVDYMMLASGGKDIPTIQAMGIKTVLYSEPHHYIPNGGMLIDNLFTTLDVATTCGGKAVRWTQANSTTYLTDIRFSDVAAKWKQSLDQISANHGAPDYVLEDTADDPYSAASPSPPCDPATGKAVSPIVWLLADKAMEAAISPYKIIFNGLANGSNKNAPGSAGLLAGPSVGGLSEVCYGTYSYAAGIHKNADAAWLTNETTEIAAVRGKRLYVCHNNETTDGSVATALDARLYQYASFALTYDLSTSIYGSHWAVGRSGLKVQPEAGLVPLDPAASEPNNIGALRGTDGAYHRLYRRCLLAGTNLGVCDVAVNPSSKAWVTLVESFKPGHYLRLSGSGVLDGGSASLAAPAPAKLGPKEAAVLFR